MGWVKEKFIEQELYRSGVSALWDQMRDAIGEAVIEFNEQTQGTPNMVSHGPCTANGKYCVRIHRAIGEHSIEVYLNEKSKTLAVLQHGKTNVISSYRVAGDRKGLEFFSAGSGNRITADMVCEIAIGDFLFTPRRPQK